MQEKQERMAQVPEGVSESKRVLWQVLSVPHPGSICSAAAFLFIRARLVADGTQHYPFIGDLAWIDGISTPVNSWDLLLVHHPHLPWEPMADVVLQACKGPSASIGGSLLLFPLQSIAGVRVDEILAEKSSRLHTFHLLFYFLISCGFFSRTLS